MSQSKVTSFYSTKKNPRRQNIKANTTESTADIDEHFKDGTLMPSNKSIDVLTSEKVKRNVDILKGKSLHSCRKNNKVKAETQTKNDDVCVKKAPTQTSTRKAKVSTQKKGNKVEDKVNSGQSKVTSFYGTASTTKKVNNKKKSENLNVTSNLTKEEHSLSVITEVHDESRENKSDLEIEEKFQKASSDPQPVSEVVLQSPKRNLSNPTIGTPPKKKPPVISESIVPQKNSSPKKFTSVSPKKLFSDEKTADIKDVKEKIMIQKKSEDLKKEILNYKNKLAKARSLEVNPCKVTSFVSSAPENSELSSLPAVPAYQRYHHLINPEISSSLTLPHKYQLLFEMFRNLDIVVSILNNRNEKITFDKVKEGVQKMMKKTFSRSHLGQILTIMPSAYDITLEKCNSKKANEPDHQLIIVPILKTEKGNIRKTKSLQNITMTPQDLSNRKNSFNTQLLNLVIFRHQEFLNRLNFPPIPVEKLKRWHPKFQVDLVPDIEVAALPEIPEAKIYTAKDVLNQVIKGSLHGKSKIAKALQKVAEKSNSNEKLAEPEPTTSKPKQPPTNSALKGVCSDLIAKIRARESAKLLETMTESPEKMKEKAMCERLPKIVQILWHYFVAERKYAVQLDAAVEKIIHSCDSLTTHEEVKAHLKLISEKFPGWLSFIEIPKGIYISINKNKNITEMLDNFKC